MTEGRARRLIQIGKSNAVLLQLYHSMVTKRELSNTASCQILNWSFLQSLPMVMNLELKILSQV